MEPVRLEMPGLQNIIPARDEYILNTSGGKKILKKTVLRPERIHFIHEAKEHIYANGFTNIDRFIQTGSNKPYILIDQEYYTLADMIEGEEYVLNGEKKLCRAAELIALMHRFCIKFPANIDKLFFIESVHFSPL
jgi:hypothetical protein